MSGVKVSEMTVDTALTGTEKLVALDGTTSKVVTTAKMAEYSIDVLSAATAGTPTTGDDIVIFRGTAEMTLPLDDVAAYAVASAWSEATEEDPVVTGDLLLVDRGGTVYSIDVDTLTDYAMTGAQALVLDLSGLATATLGGTDLLAICQGTAAKKATLTELEVKLWTDYATYVGGLTAVGAAADSDVFYCLQSGTPKKVTGTLLAAYMLAEIGSDVVDLVWDGATTTTVADADVFVLEAL